ncbi:MAG: pilus assembly protein PilM, partial [Planctomycetota bacterium]
MFCKSQVKLTSLRVDRVLLCGGGAALKGLPKFLSNGMNVPVELFDPFRVVETGGLDAEARALLEDHRSEAVIALGLATMASDPDAYSVEILPSALRKRREFVGGTLWSFVAAAVAIAYLGWYGFTTHARLSTTRTEVGGLETRVKRAKAVDGEAKELIATNEKLSAEAFRLQAVAGNGEQLARSLWAATESIPKEFSFKGLSTDWRMNEGLRVAHGEERPILHVDGISREGTASPAQLFGAFIAGVTQRLPAELAMLYNPSPDFIKFTIDLTLFAPPPPAAASEEAKN